MLDDKHQKVKYTSGEIQCHVSKTAKEITDFYTNNNIQEITAICILKGGVLFFSDLIRGISLKMSLDFIQTSTYDEETDIPYEKISLIHDISTNITGKHVLLVDDVCYNGNTLEYVLNHLSKYNPLSIKTCVLLECARFPVDFAAFHVCPMGPFVFGYGMDNRGYYRNLPDIYIDLSEE